MQSDLAVSELSAGLTITMLDGNLGAVVDPARRGVLPLEATTCWCGCIVCATDPTED